MVDPIIAVIRRRGGGPDRPPAIDGFTPVLAGADDDAMMIAEPGADELETVAGLVLLLHYVDAAGAASERRVTCASVRERNGRAYLNAFCHERAAFRSFRFDRISQAIDWRTGEIFSGAAGLAAGLAAFGAIDAKLATWPVLRA